MNVLKRLFASRAGATAIEYGLIASLISISIIGGAALLGNGVDDLLNGVSEDFVAATATE